MNNRSEKMFYEFPSSSEIIEQGDIFLNIPRVDIDFEMEILGEENKPESITWEEIVANNKDVSGILGITSVPAIVATQKCDAQKEDYITLCEIVKLSEFPAFTTLEIQSPKNRVDTLVKKNREMPGIFYLPPNDVIGFTNRMAVNFLSTIRLRRKNLEQFKSNRKGRLNKIAYEHFREKLSHFFHRYAWNEWYILNKKEIGEHDTYSKLNPTELFEWQK
jgi:hypothetical protein